jgi:drug/metabolite transporter (DMT)-like permease
MQLAEQTQAAQIQHRAATLPDRRHESSSLLFCPDATIPLVHSSGTIMCVASGAAFGAMAVFGKLAYEEGATVGTLLSVRFAFAALLFWAPLLVRGFARPARRDVGIALALGAVLYAAQAGCYFAALQRIDASLLSLVLYTFPAIVALAAVVLGRERADGRRVTALVVSSAGLALVVAGAGTGALEPLGVTLALAAALVYSTYILVGDGIARRMSPHLLSAIVCTGAAVTLTAGSAALGDLRPGALTTTGWGWLACLAVVSTVASVGLFFAGLARVGPTSASILATVEPVVTVGLAMAVFGEALGPAQLAGAVLVLAAVPILHLRRRREGSTSRGVHGIERAHAVPAERKEPPHDARPHPAHPRLPGDRRSGHRVRLGGHPAQHEHR